MVHLSVSIVAPTNKHDEYFKNQHGLHIFFRSWLPPIPPKAIVFLVHGYAEHSNRVGYQQISKKLQSEGFAVFALDHQGHGLSNGLSAHVESFQHYVDDVIQFVETVSSEYPGVPLFILGHSMGSLISLHTVLRKPTLFRGAIFTGMALSFSDTIPSWLRKIVSFMSAIMPKLQVGPPLPSEYLSRNKEAVKLYLEDTFVYRSYFRARWLSEFFSSILEAQSRLKEINIPLITIHGENDKITDVKGSYILIEGISSTDKTIKVYPEGLHELFEDDQIKDQCFDTITQWLHSHL
eukprot:TRINITY_DN378_c0_g1_i1.p1 TRINITY_DN378_c0_g1~~TRINITY_DN378_c0_g1_i1.p1  ORF type:complete len:293 (+),score=35.95 TRINITY_DN378_c0_g1_i1:154-1032(+)